MERQALTPQKVFRGTGALAGCADREEGIANPLYRV